MPCVEKESNSFDEISLCLISFFFFHKEAEMDWIKYNMGYFREKVLFVQAELN